MKTYEWQATSECVSHSGEPTVPLPPNGKGWRLVASAIYQDRALVYWYWERECQPAPEGGEKRKP